MSMINYASREINCKIVYYGPGLGGKTTNLQWIHERTRTESKGKLISLATETDRTLFRALLKVSGVGGKMALGVLSGMTAEQFSQAVQAADLAALTRLPGVGKKTAERLVVEMRDKLDAVAESPAAGRRAASVEPPAGADQDAVSALIALGYKPPEASRMVSRVFEEGMDTEAIIRAAFLDASRSAAVGSTHSTFGCSSAAIGSNDTRGSVTVVSADM